MMYVQSYIHEGKFMKSLDFNNIHEKNTYNFANINFEKTRHQKIFSKVIVIKENSKI